MEIVKSEFRIGSLLLLLILTLGLITMAAFFLLINGMLAIIFLGLMFAFMSIIMIFGYARKYLVRIIFYAEHIEVRNWIGLGRKRLYHHSDIEGYKIVIIQALQPAESLFVLSDNKRIVKVSDHYHRNYAVIKEYVASKLPPKQGLVVEPYKQGMWHFLVNEIKDTFSR